jgi:hypothetical protein
VVVDDAALGDAAAGDTVASPVAKTVHSAEQAAAAAMTGLTGSLPHGEGKPYPMRIRLYAEIP